MTKEDVVSGYMINEKHVIAEMLYDTIARYEQRIAELESPKTCDGCSYNRFGNGSDDRAVECTLTGNIEICIRGVLADYYEPKEVR